MAGATTESIAEDVKGLREDLPRVDVTLTVPPGSTPPPLKLRPRWTRHRDAGRFSYMVGLIGTILFMATGWGPGWLGFAVGYLPASALAACVTASHT